MSIHVHPLREKWNELKSELQRRFQGIGRHDVPLWKRPEQTDVQVRRPESPAESEEDPPRRTPL